MHFLILMINFFCNSQRRIIKALINQKITLEATADDSIKEIEWRVNGQKIGISNPPYFRQTMNPKPGKYLIEAVSGDQKDSVRIVVEK